MNKNKLKQYRGLLKEIELQDRALDRLYERQADLPVIANKVSASNHEFPFEPRHISVESYDPVLKDSIDQRVAIKKKLKIKAEQTALEIERYIARITDPAVRTIFEMVFVEGMSYAQAGEKVGYDKSQICRIIDKQLRCNGCNDNVCYN